MGCDIHIVLERNLGNDNWIGVHNFPYYRMAKTDAGCCFPPAEERNYNRFSKIAGVRGEGPDPRGVPENVSVLAQAEIDDWGSDGHSHSWLPIVEAAKLFAETAYELDDFGKKYPESHFFGLEPEEVAAHRIVFWFDN